jgi:hypothetical protein
LQAEVPVAYILALPPAPQPAALDLLLAVTSAVATAAPEVSAAPEMTVEAVVAPAVILETVALVISELTPGVLLAQEAAEAAAEHPTLRLLK